MNAEIMIDVTGEIAVQVARDTFAGFAAGVFDNGIAT
jgi:hypothetical protein